MQHALSSCGPQLAEVFSSFHLVKYRLSEILRLVATGSDSVLAQMNRHDQIWLQISVEHYFGICPYGALFL